MADHINPGAVLDAHRADEERVSRVIKAALDGRKTLRRTIQSTIIRRLERFIDVRGGFRRPFMQAPPGLLEAELRRLAGLHEFVWFMLVEVWLEIDDELKKAAQGYVEEMEGSDKDTSESDDDEEDLEQDSLEPDLELAVAWWKFKYGHDESHEYEEEPSEVPSDSDGDSSDTNGARSESAGDSSPHLPITETPDSQIGETGENMSVEESDSVDEDDALEDSSEDATEADSESTATNSPSEPDVSPFWAKVLEDLDSEPTDSLTWSDPDVFTEILARRVANHRQEIADLTSKRPLQEALARLIEHHNETLDALDLGVDWLNWSERQCSMSDVELVTRWVWDLSEDLRQYSEVPADPPTGIRQRREYNRHTNELLNRIEQLAQNIDPLLSPEDASRDGDSEASVDARVAEEEVEEEVEGEVEGEVEEEVEEEIEEEIEEEVEEEVEEEIEEEIEEEVKEEVEEEETLVNEIWNFIERGDLAGAYWLSRSLESRGLNISVSSSLIAGVQAARWVPLDPGGDLEFDLYEIAQGTSIENRSELRMLGLAAALRPTLFTPATGLEAWLVNPNGSQNIELLIGHIKAFSELGFALQPYDLGEVAGSQTKEEALKQASSDVAKWEEKAAAKTFARNSRARRVWRTLLREPEHLRSIIQPAIDNERNKAAEVRRALAEWEARPFVEKKIDDIRIEEFADSREPIAGDPLNMLVRAISEAASLIRRWCEACERFEESSTYGNYMLEKVADLRSGVRNTLGGLKSELTEIRSGEEGERQSAAAGCLLFAIEQLAGDLGLADGEAGLSLPISSSKIAEGLGRRLIAFPELDLDDRYQPTEESIESIGGLLQSERETKRSAEDAINSWVEKQDFRFVDELLDCVDDESIKNDLRNTCDEELQGSKDALEAAIKEAEGATEQALLDDLIDEKQRIEFLSILDAEFRRDSIRNFKPYFEELKEISYRPLQEHRQRRVEELREIWPDLLQRLRASNLATSTYADIDRLVKELLESGDTRAAEEVQSTVRNAIDANADLDEGLLADQLNDKHLPGKLEDFINLIEEIESNLVEMTVKDAVDKRVAQARGSRIPRGRGSDPRGIEIDQSVVSWSNLKNTPPHRSGVYGESLSIAQVMRYLGFVIDESQSSAVTIMKQDEGRFVHATTRMHASNLARPISKFGSRSGGLYDVLCVWGQPGIETVSARIREEKIANNSVIVLYLGKLTEAQRLRIRSIGTTVAVLDETLFVFLAGESDARLPTFLSCSMPFTDINPYVSGGRVPPEMFFGRQELAARLEDPDGACIVYGGRQLGKSALLYHVMTEFNESSDSARQRHAWVIDLKSFEDVIEEGAVGAELWIRIRETFNDAGLFKPKRSTKNPVQIQGHVKDVMDGNPNIRILMMFDESDYFLLADSKSNFRTVNALRDLMTSTQNRFKVIFAGLHNVQRYQSLPNQPLAHFGNPINVGPLEASAAEMLIRQPLGMLGYSISTKQVLQIFSYTNYHPRLIQEFCAKLVDSLKPRGMPFYQIESTPIDPIDRLYRDPNIRKEIRDMFNLTLNLDQRYRAIASSMIQVQLSDRDSYATSFKPSEIKEIGSQWWKKGFETMEDDYFRGILDEMEGLGVLVSNENGEYRLKSPNVARMTGTSDEVETYLLSLGNQEPPGTDDSENYRSTMPDSEYGPLTYQESRRLNQNRSGVAVVLSSRSLGLELLPTLIEKWHELQPAGFEQLPSDIQDVRRFRDRLDALTSRDKGDRWTCVFRPEFGQPNQLADLVRTALEKCELERSKDIQLRVILIFDPSSTRLWSELSRDLSEPLEERCYAWLAAGPWKRVAIRRRLEQFDSVPATEDNIDKLLEVTQGWPMLMDHVFRGLAMTNDLDGSREEIDGLLSSPDADLTKQFRGGIGLESNPSAERLIGELITLENQAVSDGASFEGVPESLLTPEMATPDGSGNRKSLGDALSFLETFGCVRRLAGGLVTVDPSCRRILSVK